MKRCYLGVIAAFCLAAQAQAAILDFAGLGPNNSFIPQTYGDGPTWDVSYVTRSGSFGNTPVFETSLRYWSTGYAGTTDVAWSHSIGEVFIDPLPGFFVTLNSFDLTPWQSGPFTAQYRVFDSNFNLLASGGPESLTTLKTYNIGISNPDGIRIQFQQSNFIAIDNINFDVAAVQAVPEPSSLGMLASGAAALFLGIRRRRSHR